MDPRHLEPLERLHPKANALSAFNDLAHLESLGYLERSEINGKIHFTRKPRPVQVGVGPNYVPE